MGEKKFVADSVIVNTRQVLDKVTQDFIALAKSCEYLEAELERVQKENDELKNKKED